MKPTKKLFTAYTTYYIKLNLRKISEEDRIITQDISFQDRFSDNYTGHNKI